MSNQPDHPRCRPSPPNPPSDEPPACIDSRRLMSPDGQCWICHDGQHYQLRVTAANKLILTK